MKLLLDQNISRRILKELESHYPGSTQVALIDLEEADDAAIFQYAQKHNYAIVTKDGDFLELSLIHPDPPRIVWLKCGNQNNHHILSLLVKNHSTIQALDSDPDITCLEIY